MKNYRGTLPLLALSALLSLPACSSGTTQPLAANSEKALKNLPVKTGQVFVGDVGNAKKGANISLILDFNSFATKANADGTAPKRVEDIANAKLYLTTSNIDPLGSGLIFSSLTLPYSGTAKTYTFSNVPPGGPYFVAAELFDSSSANIIEPINYGSGSTTGTRGITVSGAPNASVIVDANAVVSNNDSLTIKPILKKGIGATIGANIAPENGTFSGTVSAN